MVISKNGLTDFQRKLVEIESFVLVGQTLVFVVGL
jgi:hypothetical protein